MVPRTFSRFRSSVATPTGLALGTQAAISVPRLYNHHRPHRALCGKNPAEAFHATEKARPVERPLPSQCSWPVTPSIHRAPVSTSGRTWSASDADGPAAHTNRRCTGRRSTPAAHAWMGQPVCGSPTRRRAISKYSRLCQDLTRLLQPPRVGDSRHRIGGRDGIERFVMPSD